MLPFAGLGPFLTVQMKIPAPNSLYSVSGETLKRPNILLSEQNA